MQTERPFNKGYIQIFIICLNTSLIKSQLFNCRDAFPLSATAVALSRHAFSREILFIFGHILWFVCHDGEWQPWCWTGRLTQQPLKTRPRWKSFVCSFFTREGEQSRTLPLTWLWPPCMSLEEARSGKKGGALPAGKKRAQPLLTP